MAAPPSTSRSLTSRRARRCPAALASGSQPSAACAARSAARAAASAPPAPAAGRRAAAGRHRRCRGRPGSCRRGRARRWAWARASLAGDPAAFARRRARSSPSIDSASLSVTNGPAEPLPGEEARHRARRRLGAGPDLDRDPRRRSRAKPLPSVRGSGSAQRDDDPRGPRLDQQVGAGRAARAVVRAGLQRHVDGRAARRLAGLGERHRLGMGPAALAGSSRGRPLRRPARSRSRHWDWARSGRGRARRARAPPPSSARRSNAEPVQILVEPLELAAMLGFGAVALGEVRLLLRPDLGVGAAGRPGVDEDDRARASRPCFANRSGRR